MSRVSRRAGGAGYALLEALLAAALLLLALSLASGLLLESGRRMERAAAEATRPVTELALELLRADLHAAGAVVGGSDLPSYDPLVLTGHPAGRVTWRREERELRREVEPASGSESVRVVLPEVISFRWWRDGAGVRVDFQRVEERFRGGRRGAVRADVVQTRVVRHELYAARRNRTGRWW